MSKGIYQVEFLWPRGEWGSKNAVAGTSHVNKFEHIAVAVAAVHREMEWCGRENSAGRSADPTNYRVVRIADGAVVWQGGDPEPVEPGPCADEPTPERVRVGGCYILTCIRPDGERVQLVTWTANVACDEFQREVLIGSTSLKLVQRDAFVEVVE